MSEHEDNAIHNLWHATHCHPGECICNLMREGDLQPYRLLYAAGRVAGLREAAEIVSKRQGWHGELIANQIEQAAQGEG